MLISPPPPPPPRFLPPPNIVDVSYIWIYITEVPYIISCDLSLILFIILSTDVL